MFEFFIALSDNCPNCKKEIKFPLTSKHFTEYINQSANFKCVDCGYQCSITLRLKDSPKSQSLANKLAKEYEDLRLKFNELSDFVFMEFKP